jgi:hypothetical protein
VALSMDQPLRKSRTRAVLAAVLVLAVHAPTARAEYILFDEVTDTIDVSGQTVIATASTYEAVVMFPSGTGAAGRIFNEWTNFLEDKFLYAGPDLVGGYNFSSPCCPEASGLALAPDVFHHVAYVLDGAAGEERFYLDGALVGSRATSSFDVGDGDGLARIGAIFRDGGVAPSFIGFLDSVRLSDVARYSGDSYTAPTGDMTSDANTQLLYNFDEPPGSTMVADGGPLGRTGTLGQGFETATSPGPGSVPGEQPLDTFLCYKAKSTKGDVCSAAAPQNAGRACSAEEDCGGDAASAFCVPNKVAKGVQVTLVDPGGGAARQLDVTKGAALCNPADKNGGGIQNEADHLRSFAIKLAKGEPAFLPFEDIPITNQFGTISLETGKVDRLMIPAAKGLEQPVSPPDPPGIDHFRCAKAKVAKGSPRFEPISEVSVVDQFEQPKLYDLKKPTRICTPVDKNGEGLLLPDALLLCYQAKPGKGQPKHVKRSGLHVAHQLGLELLDTVKEEELCVPSALAPPG